MSYSEHDGQVVLTMSREDYESVLLMLGVATGYMVREGEKVDGMLALMNRLNAGNPHYRAYQVEK